MREKVIVVMSSAKRKSEKLNSELSTLQLLSKALTGGSEWCDKVSTVISVINAVTSMYGW